MSSPCGPEAPANTSLKRPRSTRSRQSCIRCRKHKLKCDGEVPCARCVKRNEGSSCQLWHRVTGRPRKTLDGAETLPGCAYYSDIVQKIALDHAQHGLPAPNMVLQLARLWLMTGVQQKGFQPPIACSKLALTCRIPISCLLEDLSLPEQASAVAPQYAFAVLNVLQGSRDSCVKIDCSPADWLKGTIPRVAPAASAASAWVHELFEQKAARQDEWPFLNEQYETATTIRGSTRYTELKNSFIRHIDECTDEVFTYHSHSAGVKAQDQVDSQIGGEQEQAEMVNSQLVQQHHPPQQLWQHEGDSWGGSSRQGEGNRAQARSSMEASSCKGEGEQAAREEGTTGETAREHPVSGQEQQESQRQRQEEVCNVLASFKLCHRDLQQRQMQHEQQHVQERRSSMDSADQIAWFGTQSCSIDSFKKWHGEIVDQASFELELLRSFAGQLNQGVQEPGVHRFEHSIPIVYRDRQGRLWNTVWEERCCLTDNGAFCHASRKIHSWGPRCYRAQQIALHFTNPFPLPPVTE